jgi:hypothetical protein
MNFIGMGWVDGIIETHGVQEMPSGGSPQVDNHPVVAVVVFEGKDFSIFDCDRNHYIYYKGKRTYGFSFAYAF